MFQSLEHEVDDLDQEPGEDEIREYAELIGIDPDTESDLLWIARAGITAPLPPDWKPIQVNNGDELYFYNFKTGESSWEHPSDDKYRKMVVEEKNKRSKQKPKTELGPLSRIIDSKASRSSVESRQPGDLPTNKAEKITPPTAVVGKLAPLGSIQSSAAGPSGKLQPIGSSGSATKPPSASVKTLAPISQIGNVPSRPKTSRGREEKEEKKEKEEAQPQKSTGVLGGGSRFLKKEDANPPDAEHGGDGDIVRNVLRFPSDESDTESISSDNSEQKSGSPKVLMTQDKAAMSTERSTGHVESAHLVKKPPPAPKSIKPEGPSTTKAPSSRDVDVEKSLNQSHSSSPSKAATSATEEKGKIQKQLQEEYERSVKQLREQHDAKLKDVKSKFEEEEKKEVEKMKRAMEERIRSLKEKLKVDEESETKSLSTSHRKVTEDLQRRFEKEKTELESKLHSEMEKSRQSIQSDHGRMGSDCEYAEMKMELESKQAEDLAALKSRLEKDLVQDNRRCEEEKRQRKEDLRHRVQKELDEWYNQEKDRRVVLMKSELEKELAQLRRNMESEQRDGMEREVSMEFEGKRRDLETEKERQLAEIRTEHDSELLRIRQRNQESLDEAVTNQRAKGIVNNTVDDPRKKQEEALRSAELELKAFRAELSALTVMAADIRHTFQHPAVRNGTNESIDQRQRTHAVTKEKAHTVPEKAGLVKSIDDLLSPNTSTRGESLSEPKLNELGREDVLDKVARFLDSQKTVTSAVRRRTGSGHANNDHNPVNRPPSRTVNDAFCTSYNDTMMPFPGISHAERPQQRGNIFRLRPKDAVDVFLDSKIEEYFRTDHIHRDQSHRHRSMFGHLDRPYTTWTRGDDIESELNSLKRWLNQFEDRIVKKERLDKSMPVKRGVLEGTSGSLQNGAGPAHAMINQVEYPEEVVEV